MPSTKKQKTKERRSRQLGIMSDVENVDVMLRSHSRNDEGDDQSENELNLDSESSRPQRNTNLTGEHFRSLLTNSGENSEIIIETTRLINEEISNQTARKLNEIKTCLNSQIQDAITAAIKNTVLPSTNNTLDMHGRTNFTVVDQDSNGLHLGPKATNSTAGDRRSSGLQRNPEVKNAQEKSENRTKKYFTQENNKQMSRQSSVDSVCSEQNRNSYP